MRIKKRPLPTSRHLLPRPRLTRPRLAWLAPLAWVALLAPLGPGVPAQPPPGDEAANLTLLDTVALTLRYDPNIALVENDYESARGALLVAKSRFDPLLDASLTESEVETPTGADTASQSSSLTTSLGLERELRTGLLLQPSLELVREDDGGPAVGRATLSFTLRQPLLRGRGREVSTADEKAARHELLARRYDLEHRIAERLASVVAQYWTVRAAWLDLEVLRATEDSSRDLLETTRRLVGADVTPAAELVQLQADLVSRQSSRVAGERALFQARQDLGREIGLDSAAVAALALPGDDWPRVEEAPGSADAARYIHRALERRADLRAGRQRQTAAEVRRRAAEDALEPQLDVLLTPSYTGLVESGGYFSPLVDNIPGLSASFGLSLSWPIRNRRAEGVLVQADASTRQSALTVELLEKAIGTDVPATLDAVARNALQVSLIDEAVGFFEQALENEIKKLRAGTSTLVDVISQRDRLTSIERQRVTARLALALSLIDLRFQTGTLFSAAPGPLGESGELAEEAQRRVGQEELTTLPRPR